MQHETLVLKFGSSVLRTDADVTAVVTEIYRHWRRGHRVVAVVSAFQGRTDEIVSLAERVGETGRSIGALLGVGEIESSAAVALGLERAGLPTRLVSPDRIGIVATGEATEAEPIATNPENIAAMRAGLDSGRVVVVPGYVARTAEDLPVVLGRGGSDLSAAFLAHALGGRAILLKDTGAVYEWDPDEQGIPPKKFESLSFDDARALGDRVLQRRAIDFAQRIGTGFTVTGLGGDAGTFVGALPSRLHERSTKHVVHAPMRVAVLGLGVVGGGVARRLAEEVDNIELVGALVRDATRARVGVLHGYPVVEDPDQIWSEHPDLVVETIGGVDAALKLTREALRRGAHVVTANKAMLAEHGQELSRLAERNAASIRGSAAVGGALPVLELVDAFNTHSRVVRVRGVLNGTTNFVLNRLSSGHDLRSALAEARASGYAEQDAAADLDGTDPANKLVCIAQTLGIHDLAVADVRRQPLVPPFASHVNGRVFRQVSELNVANGRVSASVRLVEVPDHDPLYRLPGVGNAIVIADDRGAEITRAADGAGRWPTTESVVADVLDHVAARSRAYDRTERRNTSKGSPR
ncbi:MAG: hypothetical protein AAFO89_04330 [Planctomycetota bacterium]